MDTLVDPDDGGVLLGDLREVRAWLNVGELQVVGSDLLQALDVIGRGDSEDPERSPLGALAVLHRDDLGS